MTSTSRVIIGCIEAGVGGRMVYLVSEGPAKYKVHCHGNKTVTNYGF